MNKKCFFIHNLHELLDNLLAPQLSLKSMIDIKSLDELAQRLSNSIPAGLNEIREDTEKNFRAILQSAFSKMDLVSREEFDVQTAVLARTREKLEELQTRLDALERAMRAP